MKSSEASSLRLSVTRNGVKSVDLRFPVRCARWFIDLIPEEIVQRIEAKGISLTAIQSQLSQSQELVPQTLFSLEEPERIVRVWLE